MSGDNKSNQKKKKKKQQQRGGTKKKMTAEQSAAFKSVTEWVFLGSQSSTSSADAAASSMVDDFGVQKSLGRGGQKLVFELHCHSKFSDGFLSPTKLVERAHSNGVKVLALTDHDTLLGIPEALEAARRFNIKIIPGVEISTIFTSSRLESRQEEPVHILAYYGSCGPARYEELDKLLSNIREGLFLRAWNMVSKLNKLKVPLKWEIVVRLAGKGVAPGRLHVARALFEAGHVENLKQALSRYLSDSGPAYSTGSEPSAEKMYDSYVTLGGGSVHSRASMGAERSCCRLAVIRNLKEAGLHGLEVYRSDGQMSGRHGHYTDHNRPDGCSSRAHIYNLRAQAWSPLCS